MHICRIPRRNQDIDLVGVAEKRLDRLRCVHHSVHCEIRNIAGDMSRIALFHVEGRGIAAGF
jgi:hypothetical protein